MTELDSALEILLQDLADPDRQSRYYTLFLATTFFVPIHDPTTVEGAAESLNEGDVMPLVVESEGHDYLMIFDTRERMNAWAHHEVPHVELQGEQLATTSVPPLQWALNAGTDHSKLFLSEEIAWLKQMAGGPSGGTCGCAGR